MNRRLFIKGALALTAYLVAPSLAKNDEVNRKTDVEIFQEALDTGIIEGYKFYFNHPISLFNIDDLIINRCEFIFDMSGDEEFTIEFKECNKITMTNCIIHNRL